MRVAERRRRFQLFALSLPLIALLFLTIAPAYARLDQMDDGVVGSGTPASCTEAAFQTVLSNVQGSGGGTITFNCGAAPHMITFGVYKQISAPVTIDGGNLITFSGGGTTAFFQIFDAAHLTLTNITLREGDFTGVHPLENFGELTLDNVFMTAWSTGDSAILNQGDLLIINSRISDGAQTGGDLYGAVLKNEGGDATIESSTFTGNTINGFGAGGVIAVKAGTLTVRDSTFTGNSAYDGGAIYARVPSTTTIENSTFLSNTANFGGAIESGGSRMLITGGDFTGNRATGGGGGALLATTTDLEIDGAQFSDNSATGNGGAITCGNGSATIRNTTFDRNETNGKGAGLYNTCTLDVVNSTFFRNMATGSGGGLFVEGDDPATVRHATFFENGAASGAGIYHDGIGTSSLLIGYSLVSGNMGGNCGGEIVSEGYNLTSDDMCPTFTQTGDVQDVGLTFEPFGNHGGDTDTLIPVADSPALDHIPPAACTVTADQRGMARPYGDGCDSGAVERHPTDDPLIPLYLPMVQTAE